METALLLGEHTEAKVLDVGAGTGLSGERIAEKGYKHLDGFDCSRPLLEVAQQKGIYERVLVSQGNPRGEELKLILDNTYDMVVSAN